MADNVQAEAVVSAGVRFITAETSFGGDTGHAPGCFTGIVTGAEGSRTFTLLVGGAGAVDGGTQRMTLASDDPAVAALQILDNAISGNEMQVDVVAALPAGTNNIGDVDVLTVPADPFGVNADAASATGSISAKLRFIAATGIPITGTVTVGSHAVTNAGTFAVQVDNTVTVASHHVTNAGTFAVQVSSLPASTNTIEVVGDAAHGAAVAGNPVLIGLEGRSTDGTAIDSGDVVRVLASLLGKQVTLPYAIPASTWSYAAVAGGITDTADDVAKAAGGAGTRHYITRAAVINGHATVSTEVVIKTGATILWRGFAQAAGGGCSCVFDPPLRGGDNEAINVTNITTGSATYFNLQGYSATE